MNWDCSTASNCKLTRCIKKSYGSCDLTGGTGGVQNVHVAVRNAILSKDYETVDGVTYVRQIDLNNTTNNPTSGCDKHKFYQACTESDNIAFTFNADVDTTNNDAVTRPVSLALTFTDITPELVATFEDWLRKEVEFFTQDVETGEWIYVGDGGGVKVTNYALDWGNSETPKSAILTLSGSAKKPVQWIVHTTDTDDEDTNLAEQTNAYLEDIVHDCAAQGAVAC